jgi:hypothetical protein
MMRTDGRCGAADDLPPVAREPTQCCVSMEYSKMKSRLVSSCSALATVFLAFSILFGASRASAEDFDAIGCLPPIVVAENSAEVTEALELTCLSSRATSDIAQFVSPSAIEGNDIHLWLDDALTPLAMEGSAISVEVIQSVTVAAMSQDVADGAADITGSAPSIAILDGLE